MDTETFTELTLTFHFSNGDQEFNVKNVSAKRCVETSEILLSADTVAYIQEIAYSRIPADQLHLTRIRHFIPEP